MSNLQMWDHEVGVGTEL